MLAHPLAQHASDRRRPRPPLYRPPSSSEAPLTRVEQVIPGGGDSTTNSRRQETVIIRNAFYGKLRRKYDVFLYETKMVCIRF